MPEAYVEKFSLSQFSVPPLSPALVIKTFRQYFGKSPSEIFDTFNATSVNAASIGQVHQAQKDGKTLAVKIQYPGVSDSISSDLKLVKPIAIKMFNIQGEGSDQYFREVEDKLLDETNYLLEIEQSVELAKACAHIPGLQFPGYYPELSSERIITMDWMQGEHLSEFSAHNQDPNRANALGQALWDFYKFQIHQLKKFHADPHPGNFLVSENDKLVVLDFGCIKSIPMDFYQPYFELSDKTILDHPARFAEKLHQLEILREDDTAEDRRFFTAMFHNLLQLFTRPFQSEYFDFSDKKFFDELRSFGEQYTQSAELKSKNANRGSRHFIYVNRTFFGLYNLLHNLQANRIRINTYQ